MGNDKIEYFSKWHDFNIRQSKSRIAIRICAKSLAQVRPRFQLNPSSPSNVTVFDLLQREARGSVTFKIVPSYRSAPPPCEVQVRPNTTQTISPQNTVASNDKPAPSVASSASSGGGANKSGKPVKTSAATTSKEKAPKASKASKSKSASSSTESTPRRRLNPLSALRSRKS